MYNLIVVIFNSDTNFLFTYNDKKGADEAFRKIGNLGPNDTIFLEDDWGHRGALFMKSIAGFMLSDIDQELEVDIEKKLRINRANTRLQQRTQAEPLNKLTLNG